MTFLSTFFFLFGTSDELSVWVDDFAASDATWLIRHGTLQKRHSLRVPISYFCNRNFKASFSFSRAKARVRHWFSSPSSGGPLAVVVSVCNSGNFSLSSIMYAELELAYTIREVDEGTNQSVIVPGVYGGEYRWPVLSIKP